jgi:hypothetical protein
MSHVVAKSEFDGGDARNASVLLTLYETADGVTPGNPDHPARLIEVGEAEFTVSLSDDCTKARLRWQPRGSTAMETLMLTATYPPLHGCTTYRR